MVSDCGHVTVTEIQHMHELGVRGVRLNMESGGKKVVIEDLKASLLKVAQRFKDATLQLFIAGEIWDRGSNLPELRRCSPSMF